MGRAKDSANTLKSQAKPHARSSKRDASLGTSDSKSPAKSSRRSAQQAALPGLEFKKTLSFGGSLLKGSHAKTPRPLSSKQALHIVLRSDWATGSRSLLTKERIIRNMLLKSGRRHGVRVYRVANAGNHLHLLVRFTKRRGLQNFLRASCGLIARKMLGAERGRAKKWDTYLAPAKTFERKIISAKSHADSRPNTASRQKENASPSLRAATPSLGATASHTPLIPQKEHFWSQRPFTRIVSWGRDFTSVQSYLKLNTLEALGFLTRKFTKALPTQEIRNRVLSEMSLALGTG